MGGTRLRAALATTLLSAAVAAGLVVVPAAPAAAVSAGRPTAVAVAADGSSYVGFASGGRLLRLDAGGRVTGSVPLDQAGPVDALAADGATVWVDDGTSVAQLTAAGAVVTRFDHAPASSCPSAAAHDPGRYGGLAVTSTRVYVAGRCRAALEVYTRAGSLVATVDLPGTGLPRGVAVAPGAGSVRARLYVTVPAAGRAYGYRLSTLAAGAQPVATAVLPRAGGYAAPEAGGVAADDQGHLAVLDRANNALQLFDAARSMQLYRTLGHPPASASAKGYLARPTAVVQGSPALARDFWVADALNGRVQRWTVGGTTRWMADTVPPVAPGSPTSAAPPAITGTAAVGATLTCDPGRWTGSPTAYAYAWERDGDPVAGAADPAYVVTAADDGTALTCVVTATNDAGAGVPATSAPFQVGVRRLPTTCRGTASVAVDGGARYARDPYVVLTVRAPAGAREVQVSDDGFRHYDTKPLVATCRYPWTLSGRSSRRPRVVAVRFPDVGGAARDAIVLDDSAPVLRRLTARWIPARWGWVLRPVVRERGTGVARIQAGPSPRKATWHRWPADLVSWDSSQLRWVRVMDRAGNLSPWRRTRFLH